MTCYLSLGSNLGNRSRNLQQARFLINKQVGLLKVASRIHETEPWGFKSDNKFLNQVIAVETNLSPETILALTQEIERNIGRTQKTTGQIYSDRLIDIDILMVGDIRMNTEALTLPHPQMHMRPFVIVPLSEIAPELAEDNNQPADKN
ncbi:MAG: 2-amino-4-hydroxy-6-hydroxymethyldihydropteridine diphosphokinase [Dysgonamonadaceae bacterium]|jgi:2-amino-4-hydroxy-6-hydroxymethyldihydropteridine diphosphokinase|nr:2-amino-4-hydroxy-6-hydroxymethyldihydropteridine diphosphokinase [Dysgonamonadaceae bacterium]